MRNHKTIRDLIQELEKIQNLEDKRLAVLMLYLYSEHYCLILLEANQLENKFVYSCPKCEEVTGERGLSLSEKITKLINAEVVSDELATPFGLLSKIRNRLIHDLSPNNEEINKWIEEYKPLATTPELTSLLQHEEIWVKFYVCLVTAIASIYKKINNSVYTLETIEHNTITGKWIFHVKK